MRIKTKLWKRGNNSYATTIPQSVLLLKNVDVEKPVKIVWSVDLKSGKFTIDFEEGDE